MTDALTPAQAARTELHKSTYWPSAQKQKGGNHLWLTDVHLGETIAALTTPPPPPPPPPAPSATTKPFGVLRNGSSYAQASGYDRYGMVCSGIADSDQVALLPGKKLVYMDFYEAASWFTGISQADAAPYKLVTETGVYSGTILLDPAAPGLGAKLIEGIGNFLAYHKLDGFYTDNCVADPLTFSAPIPVHYQTPATWYNAVAALTVEVGSALKARGYYVGANMIAYFPGNAGVFPGTNSDDGSSLATWIKMCAPGLSWCMVEQWMWSNNHLRGVTNPVEWDDQWDGWQNLCRVSQDNGLDFVPTIQGANGITAMVYSQASFLLDKDNNRGGGLLVDGGTDPYSLAWCKPVGNATGPKVKTGGIWSRVFESGNGGTVQVAVDPVTRVASIT